MKVAYNSGEEAVALAVYNKRRGQKLSEVLIMALSNQNSPKTSEALREYRGELFVEYAYDSQKFIMNSKRAFEKIAKKLGGLKLMVSPDPKKKNQTKSPVRFEAPPRF